MVAVQLDNRFDIALQRFRENNDPSALLSAANSNIDHARAAVMAIIGKCPEHLSIDSVASALSTAAQRNQVIKDLLPDITAFRSLICLAVAQFGIPSLSSSDRALTTLLTLGGPSISHDSQIKDAVNRTLSYWSNSAHQDKYTSARAIFKRHGF